MFASSEVVPPFHQSKARFMQGDQKPEESKLKKKKVIFAKIPIICVRNSLNCFLANLCISSNLKYKW